MSHDAIVIGAGVNGHIAAHTLARKGRKVLVLEQRVHPDTEPVSGWVPPAVIRALHLTRHGLTAPPFEPWASVALDGGERLDLGSDMAASVAAIQRLSPADAAKWPSFCARMRRLAAVLEDLYQQPAPDVETTAAGELFRLGMLGLKVRRRGRQATIDLLRILPMSAWELLDEWFASDALKAALGAAGIRHLFQGPRGGGTAFSLLHHHTGCPAGVFRQPRSTIQALLHRLPGVEVRRGARALRITVRGGRATGVVLQNGDEITAPLVLSGADPKATLVDLLEPGWLDPELVRAVRNIRSRGVTARVTLFVDRPAKFRTLTIGGSLTELERAYDDAKYGRVSAKPIITADAQDGRVVAEVQYVPHAPVGGWTDAARQALGETVARCLDEAAPGFGATVKEARVEAPGDLTASLGLSGGHAYHGELTLDQILFMRPVAGMSRHATPVGGLFLCGSGTHPGGAVLGGAGLLAARAALAAS